MIKPAVYGLLAFAGLLSLYFFITASISGFTFTVLQFQKFWYFLVSLAIGFGIQVGLFSFLKIKSQKVSVGTVGVSGTTSGVAMVSCCAHYLATLLPFLGVAGIVTFAAQYQIQLFWIGIIFNLAGIVYMSQHLLKMI